MSEILNGIYLVVDPKMGFDVLKSKVVAIVRGGVGAIQVWDHWDEAQDKVAFVKELRKIANGVPVLINNDVDLARVSEADGVHYDHPGDISPGLGGFIIGVTLSGKADWEALKDRGVDYISFCSMFPSGSADACELVDFDVVREACQRFPGSVFAAGGIDLGNVDRVLGLGVSGIALISGLLQADDPFQATRAFKNKLGRK